MRHTIRALALVAVVAHTACDASDGVYNDASIARHDATPPRPDTVVSEDAGHDAHRSTDAWVAPDDAAAPDAGAPLVEHGAICADAIPLPAGSWLDFQRVPSTGVTSTQCSPGDGPQRFYSFTLPAHMRAVISAVPDGAPWRVHMRALVACDAPDCLAETESSVLGGDATMAIDSPGSEPVTKIISVSGRDATSGGAFHIRLRLDPLPPSPTCSLPIVRALVAPSDTDSSPNDPNVPAPSCVLSPESARLYSLHLERRTDVVLTSRDGAIAIRRACDQPLGEIVCNSHSAASAAEIRTTLDRGDYYVATSGALLTFTTTTFAPNARCATPTPIADGSVFHQDFALAGQSDPTCGRDPESDTVGNPLYYMATVPAGYTLAVISDSNVGMISPPICSGGACVFHVDHHVDANYRNVGSTPRDVLVYVAATTPAVFDVGFRLVPPATNSTCATATMIGSAARLTDLRGITGGPTSDCGLATEGTLFYAIDVPPHYTLDVHANQHRDYFFDRTYLRIVDSCASGQCLAPVAAFDNALHASAVNGSDAPRTMIIEVSDPSGGNRVDLAVDLIAPAP